MKQEYRASGADAGTNGIDQLARSRQVGFAELANAHVKPAGSADGAGLSDGLGLTAGCGQHVLDPQLGLADSAKQAPGELLRRDDKNPFPVLIRGSAADRVDVGKVRFEDW